MTAAPETAAVIDADNDVERLHAVAMEKAAAAAAAHAATAATLSAADEPRAAAPSWAARQVASAQLIPTPADRLRQQQLAEAGVSTQAAALWQLSQDDL